MTAIARLSRRGRVALVVALVVVLGAGGLVVVRAGGGQSIEATVRGFFEARRDGDCERLIDYLDEATWSERGRLSRQEFLTHCDDVVDDYQPELTDVEVVSETDETAVVQMAIPLPDDLTADPPVADRPQGIAVRAPMLPLEEQTGLGVDTAYEQGELVRDGSTWRIRLDPRFLRIGRSVEQTIAGYLQAYRDGDCEAATRFVGNDAWTRHGDDTTNARPGAGRQRFVDRCEAAAEHHAEHHQDAIRPSFAVEPVAVELTATRHDRVTAEVRWNADLAQRVPLVRQDLTWRLTDPYLDVVRLAQLRGHLLRESDLGLPAPTQLEAIRSDRRNEPFALGPSGYEGTDAAERRSERGFEIGLTVSYDNSVGLVAYEFGDAPGARQYADHFAARIAQQAARQHELAPMDIPGVHGSLAAVTVCAGRSADCSEADTAAAVGARGPFVVAAEVSYGDTDPPAREILDRAANLVRTQLDRL